MEQDLEREFVTVAILARVAIVSRRGGDLLCRLEIVIVCAGAGLGLADFNDSEVQVLRVVARSIVGDVELSRLHLLFADPQIQFSVQFCQCSP